MVDAVYSVWAKKEAVYATDAVPTGANAILSVGLQTKPFDLETQGRDLDRPLRGADGSRSTNKRREFSYKVELAGSGAAGTAPAWMELNEGCGMAAPVLTAGQKAEQKFAPFGAVLSSITHTHWVGTQRRRGIGGRGDFKISMEAGKLPFIEYSWTEMLHPGGIDNVAPVGAVYNRWIEPVEVGADQTSITIHGFACVMRSIEISCNAEIAFRDLAGRKYVNRANHACAFDTLIELPDLATKDYFISALGDATGAMTILHGTVPGNIIELSAPNCQITGVADAQENGIAMLRLTGALKTIAGQDDLIVTAK